MICINNHIGEVVYTRFSKTILDIVYILGILPPDIDYTPTIRDIPTHNNRIPTYIPSTSIQEAIDKHPNDYEGLLKDLKALLRTHDTQALE